MKILVTGGAGYIGSAVTEKLVKLDHKVTVLDSLKSGHKGAITKGANLVELDLLEKDKIITLFEDNHFDAVVHLAGEIAVDESVRNPGLFFEVNDVGGLNLLNAMAKTGVKKLIFSSTAAVYGEPKRVPIKENDILEPVNPYGESKLQFERMLKWFSQIHGIQYVTFRYFNACGATEKFGEDRERETHIIPLLFELVTGKRKQFSLFGTDYDTEDGTCVRDYVHITDIAQAHAKALEEIDKLNREVFNLGSGNGYSNKQVIEAVEKVTGKKLNIIDAPRRDGDPAKLLASNKKAIEVLGWKPEYTTIEDMVRSAWDWKQNHPEGYKS